MKNHLIPDSPHISGTGTSTATGSSGKYSKYLFSILRSEVLNDPPIVREMEWNALVLSCGNKRRVDRRKHLIDPRQFCPGREIGDLVGVGYGCFPCSRSVSAVRSSSHGIDLFVTVAESVRLAETCPEPSGNTFDLRC